MIFSNCDSNLNLVKDESFGGSNIDEGFSLVNSVNGNLVLLCGSLSGISGLKTENNNGGGDNWILGIDENLDLIWQKNNWWIKQ